MKTHLNRHRIAWLGLVGMLCALGSEAFAGTTFSDPRFSESTFVSDPVRMGNQPNGGEGQPNGITSMAWAPGTNRLYVTVKGRNDANAHIQVIDNGVLQSVPFYTFNSGVETNNESGLMSLVFHPDYASGVRQIYCMLTVSMTEQRVVRFTETTDGNGNFVANGAPATIISGIPSTGNVHNGGSLAIAPDQNGNGRFLYWACGNIGRGDAAGGEKLDVTSLASKIGRANLDGSIPSDGLNESGYIWAYGYRNPYTMAVQPGTGKLWVNVVGGEYEQVFMPGPGSWAGDEWYTNGKDPGNAALLSRQIVPVVKYKTGSTDTRTLTASGATRAGSTVTYTTTTPHGFRKGEKITISDCVPASFNGNVYVLSAPSSTIFTALHPGAESAGGGGTAKTQFVGNCITGGTFNDRAGWPVDYQGNFFFGDYGTGRIMRVQLNADNTVKQVDEFMNSDDRVTDITFGPDGNLYYAIIPSGTIRKVVYTALLITTPSLPTTTVGAAFNQPLSATGGTAPYAWSVTAGALPAGLTLNPSSGSISGTPAAAGTFNFTVRVADASNTMQKAFTLVVNAAPVITTASLPGGNLGLAYSQTLAATGGTAPRTWSVTSGTLPAGITMTAATGALSGTPTVAGASNFTVTLTDAVNVSVNKAFSINVTANNAAPVFVSTPVTDGNINTPYSYTAAANGYPFPTYSLTTAPAGMVIHPSSGLIQWSPSAPGPFAVTVKAVNGIQPDATQSFTILVTAYGLGQRPLASPNLGMNPDAPPATLSATGIFSNISNLTTASALIPYGVNSPLWSDGSHKYRWIAVPFDGAPYGPEEQIGFAATGEWIFPAGTVLVKHFELSTSELNPALRKRLETRVIFVKSDQTVFGVTYKWRSDNSDADLLPDSVEEDVTITTAGGSRTQRWHYPSRNECLQCHTPGSGGVLGVRTRQQNGNFTYSSTGVTDNQLRVWNHLKLFNTQLDESLIASLPKLVPLSDNSATLEHRVRSYLDSNCAHCHRPSGTPAQFDARFDVPLANQNIINGSVADMLGVSGSKVVAPRDLLRSVMHKRMNTNDPAIRMPRLARNEIDAESVAILEQWIASLPNGTGLTGEYYDNADLTAFKLTRTDSVVDFNWEQNAPDASMGVDDYSVRWTGEVQPQYSETYTFYTNTDDGVRLWVNNQLLIDEWHNQGVTEYGATIALIAGQKYAIKMEYFEAGGGASAQLRWSSASTPKAIIPQTQLYPVGSSNTPPTVAITAPANNSTFTVPATVLIAASATDSDGTVSKVAFYRGATLLGEDTNGVDGWSYNWTGVEAGSYSLTAVATDNANATTTSTAINVIVQMNTGVGTGLTAEYYNNIDFTDLKLTRTDATVNFNWGGGAPDASMEVDDFTVRWTGEVQAQFTEIYTFYTTSDDGIRLWVNNQLLIDEWHNQGPTEYGATIALNAGQKYAIKVEYFEAGGGALAELRWSSASTAKAIIPQTQLFPAGASNTPPTVALTTPANNSTFTAPATILISATASDSDGTISKVAFYRGAILLGEDTNGADGWSYNWASVSAGSYTLTAVATDNSNATTTSTPVSITVSLADTGTGLTAEYYDNQDLTSLSLTRTDATVQFDWGQGAPIAAMGVDSYSVRWTGEVKAQHSETYTFYTTSDDGVRLWVNNQLLIDQWHNQGPTEYGATVALTAGQKYPIRVEYFEAGGGAMMELRWSSASTPKAIIPQTQLYPVGSSNTPPTVAITAPANNSTFTAPATVLIAASATDSDGTVSKVAFYRGATLLGEDTNGVDGWSYNWTGVEAGSYSLTAVATDNANAITTSAAINVVVQTNTGVGTGLTAEYYNNIDFTDLKLTRTDATVNFNWGGGAPDASMEVDDFTVRWTGEVQAQFTETYTFYTTSDDGIRLWVNNQLLIDEWHNQGPTEYGATIALNAGQKYAIKVEYFEAGGGALAELRWSSASTAKAIIPQTQLFPATVNNTPPAAPSNLIAVGASDSQVNLTWTDNATNEGAFEIERSLNGTSWSGIATLAANTSSYNDTQLMAATMYHYRVRAVNAAGNSVYAGPVTAVTMSGGGGGLPLEGLKINFQPGTAPVPAGYFADGGAIFADRGNGYSYGWNADNSATSRDRNSPAAADQRYDTLQHMQKGENPNAVWEIQVPNGNYSVRVIAGDPSNFDSTYRLNVEGILVVSGSPTTTQRWIEGTQAITVADGKLTISNAAGANNNKICFVEISTAVGSSGASSRSRVAFPVNETFLPASASMLKVGVGRNGRHAARIRATLPPLENADELVGLGIGVDIGGATAEFVLNARGSASSKLGRCAAKTDPVSGRVVLDISLNGNWTQAWQDSGLIPLNATSVKMPFAIQFGETKYGGESTLRFKNSRAVQGAQ